jgi:RNA polymerase sigma-70 factor (ECF subfamily)
MTHSEYVWFQSKGDFLTNSELGFEDLSEEALLALFVSGEPRAMAALIKRREKWLFAVAKKSIRNVSLAEEALQEGLIAIWKNAHTFRGDSQVSSWMHQIVAHACIDVLRKERIRSHASLEDLENLELIGSPSSFEDALVDGLLMHSALLELTPDQRSVIQAVDIEGRSIEEASQILGIPAGTVKSRAARSRVALKNIILGNIEPKGNQADFSNVIPLEVKNAKK